MSIGSLRIGVQSPTAASLGKFGDIPVSLYTGTPDIEIPIYKAKGRKLELPIKLRYHASGIKVEEIAGLVGLGWSLDAGGVITRTVKGIPDDCINGYYYTGNELEQVWDKIEDLSLGNDVAPDAYQYVQNALNETYGSEPDHFFYNFVGRSGQLIITPNPEDRFRTIPHKNFKVTAQLGWDSLLSTNIHTIKSWTITTEDGTRYTFSELEPHKQDTSNSLYKTYVSSWYLTKIQSADGDDIINFEYESLNYETQEMNHYEERFTNYSGAGCDMPDSTPMVHQYTYQPKLLKRITTAFEKIEFTNTPREDLTNDRKLSTIKIYEAQNLGGKKKEEWHFTYDCFSNGDDQSKRLKLDKIERKGEDGSFEKPYKFEYRESTPLPTRLSMAVDHWGFYNGKSSNDTLIPEMVVKEPFGNYKAFSGGNREPSFPYSCSGLLKKIIYPTGGSNEFEYEQHNFGKISTELVTYSHSELKQKTALAPGNGEHIVPFEVIAPENKKVPLQLTVNLGLPPGHEYNNNCEGEKVGDWCARVRIKDTDIDIRESGETLVELDPGEYDLIAETQHEHASAHATIRWMNLIPAKNRNGGGSRIYKKTTKDGMGNISERIYKYRQNISPERSSGVLVNEPRYYYISAWSGCMYLSRSSMSLVSPGMTQGSHIGYSEVKVIEYINGSKNVETDYTFISPAWIPDIIHTSDFHWPFGARTSNDWRRGKQLDQIFYNENGKIQKSVSNEWQVDTENNPLLTKNIKALAVKRSSAESSSDAYFIYFHKYMIISSWQYLVKEIINMYDQQDSGSIFIEKIFHYENPKHLWPTKTEETNSDGTQRITKIRYPADYDTSEQSSGTEKAIHRLKTDKHIHDAVIEKVVFEKKSGQSEKAVSGELVLYGEHDNDRVLPDQIRGLRSPIKIDNFKMSDEGQGAFDPHGDYVMREVFEEYDSYGRVIEHKNAINGITKYFYGDENDPFSNSKEHASGYNNVFLTGIRQLFNSLVLQNKYLYELHGNIKEHQEENGNTKKYEYDAFGRLSKVIDPGEQTVKEIDYELVGDDIDEDTPNFIETKHHRSGSEIVETKTFYNGLGEEIQELTRVGNKDLIHTSKVYDARRRVSMLYKPYEKSGSGNFDKDFHDNADAFYNTIDTPGSRTEGYPYSETEYMTDALDRVKRQSNPGSVYRMNNGKEIKHQYHTSNGTHLRNRILDENNQVTDTYTDKFGNTVETRVDPSGLDIRTQMEYDVMGNLTKVIDPEGLETAYQYDTVGFLREKTSPDAGTVKKLYDRAGNLRFVQDANHNGSQPNDVNISGNVSSGGSGGSSFTLNMPGSVEVNTEGSFNPASGNESYLYVRIKASNGTPILTVYCHAGQKVQNGKIKLPRGNYQYEIESYIQPGTSASFSFSIHCQKQYEFIYYKYDKHSRLLEVGEYKSTSLGNFEQEYADNPHFTDSSSDRSRELYYDEPSDEAVEGGGAAQRNLKGRLSYAVSRRLGKKAVTAFYSYDDDGRVEWIRYKGLGDSMKEIQYTYDRQGSIVKKEYRDYSESANNLTTHYSYDSAGRMYRVETSHSGVTEKGEAEYTFFPTGQPKRLQLGHPKAQGVDYRYNTRDWIIAINHFTLNQTTPSNDSNDRFGMNLGYDDQQNNGLSGSPIGLMLGAGPNYNGNVSWVMYRIHGLEHNMWGYPTERAGYVYRYDKANRLTRGEFAGELYGDWHGGNAYNERDITYHKNGNLTGLKRYDQNGTVVHDYSYVYYNNTNCLRRVTGSGNNYAYDHNGNMQQDLANGIGFVIYDIHNLPVRVFTTDGSPWDYAYDHEGNRVRTYNGIKTNYYINGIDGRTEVVTDKTSSWATYNLYGLDLIGQIRREGSTWNRYYFLKDHLGSIRVTVNASGNVVAYDDYYPFGALMYGRTQESSAVDGRYKYTGKERDMETRYDYFGARYYDARICRWLQVDPMAEKYPGWSPFNYSFNNPLRFFDPDGKYAVEAKYGTIVATRYTLEQAGALMTLEAAPKVGFFAMFARAISGDPSIRPTVEQYIIAGVTLKAASTLRFGMRAWKDAPKIARAIGRGSEYPKEALASFTSGMVPTEMAERLKADEAVFAKALEYDIEGLALAVPAALQIKTGKTGAYLHQIEFEYVEDKDFRNGTPTKIMLNPALKEKWKEKGFTKRQIRRKFEKYLTNIRETLIIIILVLGLLSCNSKVGDNSSSITFDSDRIAVFVESKSKDKQISNDYSNIVLLEVNNKKRHYVSKDRYFNFLTAISPNQNYVAFTSNRIGSRTELRIKGVSGPHEVYIWERENNRIKRFAENVENIFPDIMRGSYLDMKWNASNDALYFVNFNNVIFKVPLTEDTLKVLTQIIGEDVKIENISVSGDGKYLLISAIINGWRRLENIKKLILFDIHDSSKTTLYESNYFLTAGAFSYDNQRFLFRDRRNVYEYNIMDRSIREIYIHDDNEDISIGSPPYYKDDDNIIFLGETDDYVELVKYNIKSSELFNLTKNKLDKGYLDVSVKSNAKRR